MAERKKYIDVEIPILNSNTRVLGTPEQLHLKTIKLDMTRKLRGKGLLIKFRIFNQEGKLVAIPNKLELVKTYIQRMMRKRINYVEDSFKSRCSDIRVIVKPFLITRKKVSRAVRKNLRNTSRELINEYIKEKEFNLICKDILDGTLQKMILPRLKKIYPLSLCEIRVFETNELEKIDLEKASQKEEEPEIIEQQTEEASEENKEEGVEENKEETETIKEEETPEKE